MKKFILFTLALVGSIGVWGGDDVVYVRYDSSFKDDVPPTYTNLKKAVANVNDNGKIIFKSDVTSGQAVTIDKNLTIDMKGFTYTSTFSASNTSSRAIIISSGNVDFVSTDPSDLTQVLLDKPSANRGGIVANNAACWSCIRVNGASKVNINNITFKLKCAADLNNNSWAAVNYNNGSATGEIRNCEFVTGDGYYGGGIYAGGATLNVYDCVFNSTAIPTNHQQQKSGLAVASGGTMNVYGGTYTSNYLACALVFTSGGTLNIHSGTFTNTCTEHHPGTTGTYRRVGAILNDGADTKGTINIYGGTFEGDIFIRSSNDNNRINVTAGSFDRSTLYKDYNTTESFSESTTFKVTSGNEFVQDENGKYIAAPKAAPSGVYSRTVTSGSWGTICLPNDVAKGNFSGADFFMINGKQTTGGQTQIVLDQVESLEKGNPYFFQATGTTLSCTVTASSEIVSAQNENGLYGTLLGINWDATNSTHASETDVTLSNASALLLSSGELKSSIAGSALAPNRAYVVLADVPEYNPSAPVAGRRMVMSVDGKGAPNAMDEVEVEAMQTQKVIVDGKLYIRRGNQWFDAQGALVK